MRAFPLELLNSQPTPKHTLDAEIPVVGALEPEAGWQEWQGPEHEYPATMGRLSRPLGPPRTKDWTRTRASTAR
jgi:hypothetical protein